MNKKMTYIHVANPDNLFGVMLFKSYEMENFDEATEEQTSEKKEMRHESVKTNWVRNSLSFGQRLQRLFRTPRKRLKLKASVSGFK
jgi:hypothetical protein